MNDRDPERLRVVGATDLEERLLTAAAAERPSPEQSRRMAAALGLAVGAGLTAASSTTAAAAAATGSSLAWPLVSVGVAALAVAGAAAGWSHTHRAPAPPPAHVAAPAAPAAERPLAPALQPHLDPVPPAPHPRRHHAPAVPAAPDLRAEIALLDAARAAVADGDHTRALALLRRYDATCPNGAFRPESAALQVETLAHLGQTDRARALGRAFIDAHPDSPLVSRVQRAMR